MVKCSPCALAAEVRYAKPAGVCEECSCVTPYQDRLCASCSDASQRCQCCRSKRVQALISVPKETAPLLEALAVAQVQAQQQQRQLQIQQQQQQLAYSPRTERQSDNGTTTMTTTTARGSPRSRTSGSVSARGSPSSTMSFLATSPFHFTNATTYTLPPDGDDLLSATAPASSLRLDANYLDGLALVPSSAVGSVILSPSGKLVPSTLTPLSPRMAVKQNARGVAPQIRGARDAQALVDSWTKPELVSTVFHYYCNHKASRICVQLALGKFRHFVLDAGLVGPRDDALGASALSANRSDILFTQCTRPLSGQKNHMSEDQFFEALGSLALWRYGGGAASNGTGGAQSAKLAWCLDKLFTVNLAPLASEIVSSRRGGVYLRGEEFEPVVSGVLLRYEDQLRKIFVRLARTYYSDAPRADETLTHPLVEEGWKAFCREYDFFPTNVSVSSVLKLFVATATGLVRQGQQEKAAMSFDDFMHALFQLAQLSFTLTPNAKPIERVELLLSKIDAKARELAFMPSGQRARTDTPQKRVIAPPPTEDEAGQQLIPYQGERELAASGEGAYDALYNLFSPVQLSCARDLFNLFCNSGSQSSYSEIMTRVAWVKLVRESLLNDGRTFTGADGDIAFNKVLAASQQAKHSGASAFVHGRVMTFPLFARGLLELASRKYPSRPVTVAVNAIFADHFEPLLRQKVEALQEAQRAIQLPLGAGLNGSGSMQAGPGNWGSKDWRDSFDQLALGSSASDTGSLYPNHPSHPAEVDVEQVMISDPDIATVFQSFAKVLERAFFRASWEGVEAQNGVSIPRIGSALLIHAAPNIAMQNAESWDHFLQQKNLLGEHSFRRWCSQLKIVPELIAHKQVTALFREGNVGFDRAQNQFVLNYSEFQATLLRIALLAFSGSGYAAYSTPASKLELLFFIVDSNTGGSFGFRGFKFAPLSVTQGVDGQQQHDSNALAARNMGKALWERKTAGELGVRALLMAGDSNGHDAPPTIASSPKAAIPQSGGHGVPGPVALTSPTHATTHHRNFTTSMASPRLSFATPHRGVDPERPEPPLMNEPALSTTGQLFQATPFPVQQLASTRFAQNVPHYSNKPLRAPKNRHKLAAQAAAAASAAAAAAAAADASTTAT